MNLDRRILCAYCKKFIEANSDFYGCSFGTSSNAAMPMTSIAGVHWDCTYKIIDRWVRDRAMLKPLPKPGKRRAEGKEKS